INQTQFFQLAYNIWSRIDLVAILQQQRITPQPNVRYAPDRFVTAIMMHSYAGRLLGRPELHCANNG
ncbi:ribonuclease S-7-like, partial [Trifolium medium]|nr:ribonuclease S-7-like [Trifolium medium]